MAKRPTLIFKSLGGLDFDSADSQIAPEDYRFAENMRNSVSYAGQQFIPCNMNGNVLVAYNLTSANCKCLGGIEDKQDGTILYFVWSDDLKHKILRYYPADNSNGSIQLVTEFNFNWKRRERITGIDFISGNLLYWTDSVKPRAINTDKANNTNKFKSWMIHLPVSTSSADSFQIVIRDIVTNAAIFSQQINIPAGTREEKLKALGDAINDVGQSLHVYITAEVCDCSVTITEKDVNAYNVVFTNPDYKVVPENWYGKNLVDRFFDANKYPPGCQPNVEYKEDSSVNYNFVRDKVLFFRLGYEYMDFQQSALGPISTVAVNNQICNEGAVEKYNYIDIDFNDANLLDPNLWVILKKVGVYVKERNSGNWMKVGKSVEVCDFFDLVDGVEAAHFKFYNNINTSAISATLADKQYDNTPLVANAQKFANNKLTYAGIREGRDAPECAEADLSVTFNEIIQQEYFDVTFRVRFCNQGFGFHSNTPFQVGFSGILDNSVIFADRRRGCIVRNDGTSYPMWGGVSKTNVRTDQTGWDQSIPLGGTLVYSAGTSIYGIGKQVQSGGLLTDEFGAFLTEGTKADAIKAYLDGGGDCYQLVKLRLPKGKHVIRVASHLCSDGDVLQRGKIYDITNNLYHLTSTNVFRINDPNGNFLGDTEVAINVTQDEYFGEILIADTMIDDHSGLINRSIYGFLLDINLFNVLGQVAKCIGIEKQTVACSIGTFYPQFDPTSFPQYINQGNVGVTYTDHNGYFFFSLSAAGGVTTAVICAFGAQNQIISQNTDTKYYGDIGQVYDNVILPQTTPLSFANNGTAYIYNNPQQNKWSQGDPTEHWYNVLGQEVQSGGTGQFDITQVSREVLVLNTNPIFRPNYTTVIKGRTVDANGTGICCINAVYAYNSRMAKTQTDGDFTILVFADGRHVISETFGGPWPIYVGPQSNSRRQDYLYLNSGDCPVTFPTDQILVTIDPFGANVTDVPPPYSSTAWYDVGDIMCTLLYSNFIKSAKRGGRYALVLRYQDLQGRQCSCVSAAEIYIPFFGEDLNKYFPNQYPAGTFSNGSPIITWTLPSTFKPPIWAAKYQWMRTKNLNQTDYIQWLINDVKYVLSTDDSNVPIETTYGNFNATQIWVSLKNIQVYQREHPDSTVAFQFEIGQRIRFINNEDGNPFNQYVDVKVTGMKDEWLILDYFDDIGEVKTSMLIEATSLRKIDAQDIYYECGECYDCTAPGQANNEHSVLSAPFTWGDTYWVKRSIPIRDTTDIAITADVIHVMESSSINDFYLSKDEDLGRPGIISDKFRELYRGTAFRVSNQYIPDTGVNGLCNFDNVDDVELGREFGDVMSLQTTGFVISAICQNKLVSNYLGAVQGATPQGDLIIASQQGYIGDSRPLLGDFGTQHPATVVFKDGWGWGVDFQRAIAWKYDNNGLDTISDRKMKTFFKALSKTGIWDAVASYDAFYGEYILTAWENRFDDRVSTSFFNGVLEIKTNNPNWYNDGDTIELTVVDKNTNEVSAVYGYVTGVNGNVVSAVMENWTYEPKSVTVRMKGTGRTIAYQKDKQRWTSFYSYLPDAICAVGMKLVTWNNGQLYLHDVGPIGTFYGLFYKWKLTLLCKAEGLPVLLWNALLLEQTQNGQDKVNSWSVPVISNNLNQLSRITKGSFERLEEFWNASFRKDLNTLSEPNPIVDGKDLRSSVLKLEMENDAQERADLESTNVLVIDSSGNR